MAVLVTEGVGEGEAVMSDGGVVVGCGTEAAMKAVAFLVTHSAPSLDWIRVVGGVLVASVNLVPRAPASTSFI